MILIGTYHANTSIDISSYSSKSESSFLAIPSGSASAHTGQVNPGEAGNAIAEGSYNAPSITISGNNLNLTVASFDLTCSKRYLSTRTGRAFGGGSIATSLYYIG